MRAALGALALAGGLGCGGPAPPPGTPEELRWLTARFQKALDRLRDKVGFPGATAAFILADGRTASIATGVADKELATAMTADARMPAGSVGKTFAAAVALNLVKEGKLQLDGNIEQWLGDRPWFGRLPNAHEITLRHLLTHSAGLADHYKVEGFAKLLEAGRETGDPDWHVTPEQAVACILDTKPLFPAGKGFSYTDTGYILVGLIIEKVTGSTYYEEVQRRFLQPLELKSTGPSDHRAIPGLVPGYLAADNPLGLPAKTANGSTMVFSPASEWTGGGLYSNPLDLVRWAKVLYEGRAMKIAYMEDLLRGVPWGDSTTIRYGLGVIESETPLGTRYGHSGWFPGYVTDVRYYPRERVAVAIQANSDANRETGTFITALSKAVLR
jgi:D-alanyl-D-alanine carboxypeptidase